MKPYLTNTNTPRAADLADLHWAIGPKENPAPKLAVSAEHIAQQAVDLVGGDRQNTHGDKFANHMKIAAVWNGILTAAGKPPSTLLDAHDVANMMEGLKIARRYLGAFNVDDYVDGAGYAACAGEIRARME